MSRDLAADVAAILHPMPGPNDDPENEDVYDAWRENVAQEQQSTADHLRLSFEEGDQDPLLVSLAAARAARDQAEEQIRQLLAYGREFVSPRPYTLAALAEASGYRESGVRTAYDHDDVAAVAAATGAKPREWRAADPEPPLTLPDLIADLRRRSQQPERVTELYDLLNGSGWTPSVPQARVPGTRTTRRYIVWRRTWAQGATVTLYQDPSTLATGNNVTEADPRRFYVNYIARTFDEVSSALGFLNHRIDLYRADSIVLDDEAAQAQPLNLDPLFNAGRSPAGQDEDQQ